jgi:hypothetical protein
MKTVNLHIIRKFDGAAVLSVAFSMLLVAASSFVSVSCASKEDQEASRQFSTLVEQRYKKLHPDQSHFDRSVWDKAKAQIKAENPELWARVDAASFVQRESMKAVMHDMDVHPSVPDHTETPTVVRPTVTTNTNCKM